MNDKRYRLWVAVDEKNIHNATAYVTSLASFASLLSAMFEEVALDPTAKGIRATLYWKAEGKAKVWPHSRMISVPCRGLLFNRKPGSAYTTISFSDLVTEAGNITRRANYAQAIQRARRR